MGSVILSSRFRADIADFPRLKPNLGDLLPTSAWQTVQKKLYLTVFAGQSRRQAGHGEIEVIRSGSCQLGPVTVDTTDQRTGALRLTGVRGSIVSFTYAAGRGTLSLRTHTFSLSHQS